MFIIVKCLHQIMIFRCEKLFIYAGKKFVFIYLEKFVFPSCIKLIFLILSWTPYLVHLIKILVPSSLNSQFILLHRMLYQSLSNSVAAKRIYPNYMCYPQLVHCCQPPQKNYSTSLIYNSTSFLWGLHFSWPMSSIAKYVYDLSRNISSIWRIVVIFCVYKQNDGRF